MSVSPSSPFAVQLDFFTGPMDLLLHLVHQQEVDIGKVRLGLVAEQYLEIISSSRFLDLEKASEYLVIAATLVSIKSRMLLPSAEVEPIEEGLLSGLEDSERFYEELRARLKTYELTKARAQALCQLPQYGVDTFSRVDRKSLLPTPEMLGTEPEDIASLGSMFAQLLKRVGGAMRGMLIRMEHVSVVSYMMKVLECMQEGPHFKNPLSFVSMMKQLVKREPTLLSSARAEAKEARKMKARGMVIGSFIAVLELAKRGVLGVTTVKREGKIGEGEIELSPKLLADDSPDLNFAEISAEYDSSTSSGALSSEHTVSDSNNVVDMAEYRRSASIAAGASLVEPNEGNGDITSAEEFPLKEVSRG